MNILVVFLWEFSIGVQSNHTCDRSHLTSAQNRGKNWQQNNNVESLDWIHIETVYLTAATKR